MIDRSVLLLTRLMRLAVASVAYVVAWLVPKDSNEWVFGAWFGKDYADNSKYLFEYVLQNRKDIKAIWVTKNRSVEAMLKAVQKPVVTMWSLSGLLAIMRAGVAVLCTGKSDISWFLLTRRHVVIQLWHGVGSKKIGRDNSMTARYKRRQIWQKLARLVFPALRNLKWYDLFISTSPLSQSRFCSAFGMPSSRVPITGYPRNDVMFRERNSTLSRAAAGLPEAPKHKWLFCYVPTHRGEGTGQIAKILPDEATLALIEAFLEETGGILLMKLHHYDRRFLPNTDNYERIVSVDGSLSGDLYPVLPLTDVLITDYSSIYFDFLLLNRPIIFAAFDLQEYQQRDREFYDRYEDVAPGPIARDWSEVLECMRKAVMGKDEYGDARVALRDLFHTHVDGRSSERIVQLVTRLVGV